MNFNQPKRPSKSSYQEISKSKKHTSQEMNPYNYMDQESRIEF
jgi:hypothetical protein